MVPSVSLERSLRNVQGGILNVAKVWFFWDNADTHSLAEAKFPVPLFVWSHLFSGIEVATQDYPYCFSYFNDLLMYEADREMRHECTCWLGLCFLRRQFFLYYISLAVSHLHVRRTHRYARSGGSETEKKKNATIVESFRSKLIARRHIVENEFAINGLSDAGWALWKCRFYVVSCLGFFEFYLARGCAMNETGKIPACCASTLVASSDLGVFGIYGSLCTEKFRRRQVGFIMFEYQRMYCTRLMLGVWLKWIIIGSEFFIPRKDL